MSCRDGLLRPSAMPAIMCKDSLRMENADLRVHLRRLPDTLRENCAESAARDFLPEVRGQAQRDTALGFQRWKRLRERRVWEVIQRFFRRRLLRRRLCLPLTSNNGTGGTGFGLCLWAKTPRFCGTGLSPNFTSEHLFVIRRFRGRSCSSALLLFCCSLPAPPFSL